MNGDVHRAAATRSTPATRPATPPSTTPSASAACSRTPERGRATKAGEKVGDAAEKLSDWLRDRSVEQRPRDAPGYSAGAIGWLERKMSPGSTCVLMRRRRRWVTSS